MMRFGPADGPLVVIAPPLFEEASRTRALVVAMLRGLADRGIAGALPDLPGQGDSLAPLEAQTIPSLRVAYEALVASFGRRCYGVAVRSGALLDAPAGLHARWRLAPQGGAALIRELTRVKQAEFGAARRLSERWWINADPPIRVAGSPLSSDLLQELGPAEPFAGPGVPLRTVRLGGDPAAADLHLPGAPPWRRSEQDADPVLSQALAADIANWVAACERR